MRCVPSWLWQGGDLHRPPENHVSGPSVAVLDRACTPAHSLSGSCSAPPASLCHQSPILQTIDDTVRPEHPPINKHDPTIAPRTFRITSKICSASSRVGDSTIAPSPCAKSQLDRYRLSRSGIANASVFPEPVLAAPNTSRPASRWGIAALWMAVMSVYAAALSPRRVRLERGKCSNLLAVARVGRLAASVLLLFLPLVGAPGTLCNTVVMGWASSWFGWYPAHRCLETDALLQLRHLIGTGACLGALGSRLLLGVVLPSATSHLTARQVTAK